ncbi:MAG TPA: pyruvate kinase [Acidimicrobiales bacterium]|nr:pyruvate kinase [Acidimicrobiales bacterium]
MAQVEVLGGTRQPHGCDTRAREQAREGQAVRRTKIVASIGPASWDEPVLRKIIAAGADVIRINLSHGEPAAQLALIDRVRGVSTEENRTVGVLVDLPGPKLRMAPFPDDGVDLVPGDIVELRCGAPASDRHVIGVDLDDLGLAAGDRIMGGDGAVVLEVVDDVDGDRSARAEVRRGGRLQGRPGIHLPDGVGGVAGPTDRDLELAAAAREAGADAVAASFVHRAADVQRLIEALGDDRPQVVAKIETASAVAEADEILAIADAVMVARGDLGIRLPIEDVPHVQKRLVRAAIAAGRPVITATQMLESMITAAYPTRAEVSDVANAVFDGTDAVMLSAETAVGAEPAEAVAVMASVVRRAEREADYLQWGAKLGKLRRSRPLSTTARITDATSEGAWRAATSVGAAAIVCCTRTGDTARAVARFRPTVPVLAVSPSEHSVRALSLTWGVTAVRGRPWHTTDDMVWFATQEAMAAGVAGAGDVIVVIGGYPGDPDPAADVLRVVRLH